MSLEIFEIRPRFAVAVNLTGGDIVEKLRNGVGLPASKIIGAFTPNYIVLTVKGEDQPFWKPQLALSLEEKGGKTHISGLYGPSSEVWMMFMFFYMLCGLLTLFILIIGLSQYNLGMSAYILWVVPFTLGGMFVLWLSNRAGQKLAQTEMRQIQKFIDEILFQGQK